MPSSINIPPCTGMCWWRLCSIRNRPRATFRRTNISAAWRSRKAQGEWLSSLERRVVPLGGLLVWPRCRWRGSVGCIERRDLGPMDHQALRRHCHCPGSLRGAVPLHASQCARICRCQLQGAGNGNQRHPGPPGIRTIQPGESGACSRTRPGGADCQGSANCSRAGYFL